MRECGDELNKAVAKASRRWRVTCSLDCALLIWRGLYNTLHRRPKLTDSARVIKSQICLSHLKHNVCEERDFEKGLPRAKYYAN